MRGMAVQQRGRSVPWGAQWISQLVSRGRSMSYSGGACQPDEEEAKKEGRPTTCKFPPSWLHVFLYSQGRLRPIIMGINRHFPLTPDGMV